MSIVPTIINIARNYTQPFRRSTSDGRSWIEISSSAFCHNIELIKSKYPNKNIGMSLKANAYGHGLLTMAQLAQNTDKIAFFCVSDVNDLSLLRAAGITKEIYIECEASGSRSHPSTRSAPSGRTVASKFVSIQNCSIITSDMSGIAQRATEDRMAECLYEAHFIHVSQKKSEIERKPDESAFILDANTFACVGALVYGLTDAIHNNLQHDNGINLKSFLAWKTKLFRIKKIPPGTPVGYARTFIAQRPTVIGILPIGYADGLPRSFSNTHFVSIRQKLVPIIGMISMNLAAIDVTDINKPEVDDEVILMGNFDASRGTHSLNSSLELIVRLPNSLQRIIVP